MCGQKAHLKVKKMRRLFVILLVVVVFVCLLAFKFWYSPADPFSCENKLKIQKSLIENAKKEILQMHDEIGQTRRDGNILALQLLHEREWNILTKNQDLEPLEVNRIYTTFNLETEELKVELFKEGKKLPQKMFIFIHPNNGFAFVRFSEQWTEINLAAGPNEAHIYVKEGEDRVKILFSSFDGGNHWLLVEEIPCHSRG